MAAHRSSYPCPDPTHTCQRPQTRVSDRRECVVYVRRGGAERQRGEARGRGRERKGERERG
eukprot:1173700-Rhodomonas_salina.1